MNGTQHSSTVYLGITSLNWRSIATGDFNSDGKADILWQNISTGQHSIWHMNGTICASTYDLPQSDPLTWVISAVGDFNSDGNPTSCGGTYKLARQAFGL